MHLSIRQLEKTYFPRELMEMPDPPKKLFIVGELPRERVYLTVVGSRKFSNYGYDACVKIISELSEFPFTIVSGLALGIDAIAHKTALDAGLPTVAIPGSGLDINTIYPRSNLNIAKKIVENGGALLSEYEPKQKAMAYMFPERNRLMAAISSGVLIVEAREKSGTLITARLATEYNKDVFAVPGSIFSSNMRGGNQLIKMGAVPVTCGQDIALHYGFDIPEKISVSLLENLGQEENELYKLLENEIHKDEVLTLLKWKASKLNSVVTSLLLRDIINERDGFICRK